MHPDKILCTDMLVYDFLMIMFQKIYVLHWIYTANKNKHILYISINRKHQVNPGLKMNRVELPSVKTTLFENKFRFIYTHVSWVSALQICFDDVLLFPSFLLAQSPQSFSISNTWDSDVVLPKYSEVVSF